MRVERLGSCMPWRTYVLSSPSPHCSDQRTLSSLRAQSSVTLAPTSPLAKFIQQCKGKPTKLHPPPLTYPASQKQAKHPKSAPNSSNPHRSSPTSTSQPPPRAKRPSRATSRRTCILPASSPPRPCRARTAWMMAPCASSSSTERGRVRSIGACVLIFSRFVSVDLVVV
jgi:hypothetical protein